MASSRSNAGSPNTVRRAGVSLIQLLASIAILVTLIAILLPVISKMTDKIDCIKCMQNLKTYATHAASYTADYDGRIPGIYLDNPRPIPTTSIAWQFQLKNYPNQPVPHQPFMCPACVKKLKGQGRIPPDPNASTNWTWWTGYNTNLYFSDASGIAGSHNAHGFKNPARIFQITSPSLTPLYMCVNFWSAKNADAYGGYMEDGKGPWAYEFWAAHSGAFNIAFFDGHVERVPFNKEGKFEGKGAGDYPQFIWKPF